MKHKLRESLGTLVLVVMLGVVPALAKAAPPSPLATPGTWEGTLQITQIDLFQSGESAVYYHLVESDTERQYTLEFERIFNSPGNNHQISL